MPIDPNEPLYCYCQQISYGEMVACDNTDVSFYKYVFFKRKKKQTKRYLFFLIFFFSKCEVEWFHLACVDLKTVPKGKWYCSNCILKMKGRQRK